MNYFPRIGQDNRSKTVTAGLPNVNIPISQAVYYIDLKVTG